MPSILIIEDEPDLRNSLKELLEMEGFNVATAENGEQGLQALQQIEKQDRACLILLDLMMPVMNGWQFLEELKQRHGSISGMPIVVVSAAVELGGLQRLYGCGVMKKPVSIDDIISMANQYCHAE